jgi:hypothetical protein
MHEIGLFEAEEDDLVLIHIFSSAFLGFMFPFDEILPYMSFDTQLSSKERSRIMDFYRRCVQRHLYVFGKQKRFLSKNPTFCCKVNSLYETFPDGKIIYMVRSPYEAIPSAISWMSYGFNTFNSFPEPYQTDRILNWISHWYRYPLEEIEKHSHENYAIEKYDNLIKNPEKTVDGFYKQFGFEMTREFGCILEEETQKAQRHDSKHVYSLRQFGLTHKQILSKYHDVFSRFDFDTMKEGGTSTKI